MAKPSVPPDTLQEALDYACGEGGADCEEIRPHGSCYFPDTAVAHASYAFNSYWQKYKNSGGSCTFGGTAMIINSDPSNASSYFLIFQFNGFYIMVCVSVSRILNFAWLSFMMFGGRNLNMCMDYELVSAKYFRTRFREPKVKFSLPHTHYFIDEGRVILLIAVLALVLGIFMILILDGFCLWWLPFLFFFLLLFLP